VEEEENVNDILAKLKLVENAAGGLYMFDAELGKRVPTATTTTAASNA